VFNGGRQEVDVHANQKKCRVKGGGVTRLLIYLALVLCSAANARAQAEAARDPHGDGLERAATEARQHLRSALASEDGNRRIPAMRVARFMDEPWMAELALPYCQSPDFGERVLALEVVTKTNPALGRAVFIDALTSGERALRLRGLLGLAALADPTTVPDLVRIMQEDLDPDLQAVAAQALGKVGDIQASAPLYEAIEDHDPPVREQAVLALIAIGDEGLRAYLVDRLQNDHYPGEAETLRLIALVPDPGLIPVIEPYLKNDNLEKRTLAAAAILSILKRSGNAQP
jgi:HEAT repeat protein